MPLNLRINGGFVELSTPSITFIFGIGISLGINVIYFVLLDRLMMAIVQRRTGP